MFAKREWLIKLRSEKTQQFVAEKAGINRSYYTQIENGIRTPSVEVAKKIAEVLNFPWTYFFEEDSLKMQQYKPTGTGGE